MWQCRPRRSTSSSSTNAIARSTAAWRQLLDYFDAQIIGLTATPTDPDRALSSTKTSLRNIRTRSRSSDGVNVPFEVFRIRTQIGEHGGRVEAGLYPSRPRSSHHPPHKRYPDCLTTTSLYSAHRPRPQRHRPQPDPHRASKLTAIPCSPSCSPGVPKCPKTLIFAKDDHHAEEIVMIVREVFEQAATSSRRRSPTRSAPNTPRIGDRRASATSIIPRVAVTVDMIATGHRREGDRGADLPARRAFVGLLRADARARRADDRPGGARGDHAGRRDVKDRFVLVDAVGVTDSLKIAVGPA